MTACTEQDCNATATRRGLCGRHYQQRWRAGTLPPRRLYSCRVADDECAGGYLGAGLCRRHYFRQYARGTTQLTTLKTAPDDVRYRAGVAVGKPGECWPWTGTIISTTGYGQIFWDGRHVSAHIAGWELATGLIAAGFWLDHTCHNRDMNCPGREDCLHRRCQNPIHWEAVTPGVNLARSRLTTVSLGWAARGASESDYEALAVVMIKAGVTGTWKLPDCPCGHPLSGENKIVHQEHGTIGCRTCMLRTKSFRNHWLLRQE